MKTFVIYNSPFSWLNPFVDLKIVEPGFETFNTVNEDISETPFGYQYKFSMGEFKKKNLNIKVENNELVLEANRKKSNAFFKKGKNEVSSTYSRRIMLSEDMDTDKISAKFKHGLLSIDIPKKAEHIKYREIPVLGASPEEENQKANKDEKQKMFQGLKTKFRNKIKKAA